LNDLIIKCTGPNGVRNYFDVGVIGYGEKVESGFTGVLAKRDLVPLSDVAKYRSGGVSKQGTGSPVWFAPVAEGDTPMCTALRRTYDVVGDWVLRHPAAFPSIVVNITDGEATDGNPTEPAHRLTNLSTADGNVLIFNCDISARKGKPVLFPCNAKALPAYGPRLFQMSSVLPSKFRDAAKNLGFSLLDNDARGFAFNAELTDLVRFLDLGKHTLIAQVATQEVLPTGVSSNNRMMSGEYDRSARENEIRLIAFHIWEEENRPDARDVEEWLKAEKIWESKHTNKGDYILNAN
jgi:hypothetical protein